MTDLTITIIGAGVVGLAIARKLSENYENIAVIERYDSFGRETSSRNSEVIHDGTNYPPGSLKARFCVQGNRLLYEICKKHSIEYKRLGKLTVATETSDIGSLESLRKNGIKNGVTDLLFLEPSDIKKIEPHLHAQLALFSPDTGIVDTHGLMRHFADAAQSRGAMIVYNSEVVGIDKKPSGFAFRVRNVDGSADEFTTRVVINSAGLFSDRIAEMAGINVDGARYRLHYCKGDYMSWTKGHIHHLIYPIPVNHSKGIHAGLDLKGNVRFGPNAYYVSDINYDVTSSREEFYHSVRTYLPSVEIDDLSPAMSGIRPKLQAPDEGFRDFIIGDESERGLTGLINLIGIESPGLTASPAIAAHVAELTDSLLA